MAIKFSFYILQSDYINKSCKFLKHLLQYIISVSVVLPQVVDGGYGLQIWKVAMNILNKQLQTADKG
jgi:hypothetical protein